MNNTAAIIDIGSSSIKMKIYQLFPDKFDAVENLRQHVRLGIDCFYEGKISKKSINESISILKRYVKLCNDYKVKTIKAVATTAVREAVNSDVFIDNIFRNTGITVELIYTDKESEIIYRSILDILNKKKIAYKNDYWAIIEIGAGNIEITILEGSCILFTRSLPLGILRTKQMFLKEYKDTDEKYSDFLDVMINHELKNLEQNMPKFNIQKIFFVGTEVNYLPEIFLNQDEDMPLIGKTALKKLYLKIKDNTEEQLFHSIKIPYDLTDSFIPAYHILLKITDFFKCKNLIIPKVSLTDGVVNDLFYVQEDKDYYKNLEKQLKINAVNFGRSMKFDEKHAIKVMELALKMFDQTKEIHRLGELERCYLMVASLLHDIGSRISYRNHHKHSLYIIKSLAFFSFNVHQINLIANIARYHRKSPPKSSHIDYMQLSMPDRMIVIKLSSILRIADSLDNTHLQLIKDINIDIKDEKIIINSYIEEDIITEFYALKYKKSLFEDFFVMEIILNKIRQKDKK